MYTMAAGAKRRRNAANSGIGMDRKSWSLVLGAYACGGGEQRLEERWSFWHRRCDEKPCMLSRRVWRARAHTPSCVAFIPDLSYVGLLTVNFGEKGKPTYLPPTRRGLRPLKTYVPTSK